MKPHLIGTVVVLSILTTVNAQAELRHVEIKTLGMD